VDFDFDFIFIFTLPFRVNFAFIFSFCFSFHFSCSSPRLPRFPRLLRPPRLVRRSDSPALRPSDPPTLATESFPTHQPHAYGWVKTQEVSCQGGRSVDVHPVQCSGSLFTSQSLSNPRKGIMDIIQGKGFESEGCRVWQSTAECSRVWQWEVVLVPQSWLGDRGTISNSELSTPVSAYDRHLTVESTFSEHWIGGDFPQNMSGTIR
jgi:hypothetical protein